MGLGISKADVFRSKESKERTLTRAKREIEEALDKLLQYPELFGTNQESLEFQFLTYMEMRESLKGIPSGKSPLRSAYINFCSSIGERTNSYLFGKKLNTRELIDHLKKFREEYCEATK